MKLNGDDNQYQLDAGQKNFGATQCAECGIVYQIGDPEDENAHLNYHNNKKSLKFSVRINYMHVVCVNNVFDIPPKKLFLGLENRTCNYGGSIYIKSSNLGRTK